MSQSYIGSTIAIAAARPSAQTVEAYQALSYTKIGKIINAAEIGPAAEDVSFTDLESGAVIHINGAADIGDVVFGIDTDLGDAGQDIARDGNNTNAVHSIRVRDSDGDERYFHGIIANYRDSERQASSYKGASFALRGQSAVIFDLPPGIDFERNPLRVPEGASGNSRPRLRFRLQARPSSSVTVTISGHAGTDVTLQNTSRTFTPANWNQWQDTRIAAANNSAPAEVELTFTPNAAGGYAASDAGTMTVEIFDPDA